MSMSEKEREWLEFPMVVAGAHPRPHYRGFYHLLFDRLPIPGMAIAAEDLSGEFLTHYRGKILCLAQSYANWLYSRPGQFETVLIDHGPFPAGWRTQKDIFVDHLIINGSEELLEQMNLSGVGHVCNAGYFPTDYCLPERREKTAMVQITCRNISGTWQDDCPFRVSEVCELLLERGFEVAVYDHVMHPSDLDGLSESVRLVKPGLDYIQSLSSCSHLVFSGTSGFITNMFTQGCTMIVLSYDWAGKNPPMFQGLLHDCCDFVQTPWELFRSLSYPSKYDMETSEFLFGREPYHVIEKIWDYLTKIS